MEENKKKFKTARTIFNRLKTDPPSVVFAEEHSIKTAAQIKKVKVCRRQKKF